MDLFEMNLNKNIEKNAPLADRVRPKKLEDFNGQEHFIGEGMPLFRMIKADRINSMIFYGPPGTGKTTLAMIISNQTKSLFQKISAVTSGIKDIRDVIDQAENNLKYYNKKTILFIDEIHRFNKTQQDALLPFVENGTVTLIGATTENPYFEVNKALVSRCQILEFKKLDVSAIVKTLEKALKDNINGLGKMPIEISRDNLELLAQISGGDARNSLNSLEIAAMSTEPDDDGIIRIHGDDIRNSLSKNIARYDKNSDDHYDTISAFIKSMRGSDPDAAIFYLAKMINSGEDPKFIARRMIIFASEDIGNADPQALNVAINVFNGINVVGMPEGRIILSQGVAYLASAPKSNASYVAISEAVSDVKSGVNLDVPSHLKDAHYNNAKDLNRGIGYKYPHDYEDAYVEQQYIPDGLSHKKYYRPSKRGYEIIIGEHLDKIRRGNI